MNGIRMTDEELTAVFKQYRDMVFRIALVHTGQQALAEDIVQDVFLALVRHSASIRSQAHLKYWLIRVTVNKCNGHFSKPWVKLTVFYNDLLLKKTEEDTENAYQTGDIAEEAAEEADREEMNHLVREAVELLPKLYRIPVHLFYYEKLSVKEIAGITGSSESRVKTQLSRARSRLRKMLGGMTA